MSAIRKKNRVIEEFIEIYKSEPCLWRIKSKEYHDRTKRDAAYQTLLHKLREIEPEAVKETVMKKINNLRSNVRKERKKYEASLKSGASADEVWKPTLWYYELFDFLSDQGIPSASVSNLVDDERSESDEDDIEETPSSEKNAVPAAPSISNPPLPANVFEKHRPPNKKKKKNDLTDEVLMSVRDHLKQPHVDDRYDLIGKTVAMRVRGLEKRQALIAEKRINDILFEAEMGTLTLPRANYSDNRVRNINLNSGSSSSGSFTSPPCTVVTPPEQVISHKSGPNTIEVEDEFTQLSQSNAASFISSFSEYEIL